MPEDLTTGTSRQTGGRRPREERQILFDRAETYQAIYTLCVQKQLRAPQPGSIAAIEMKPCQSVMALRIENPQNGAATTCEYSCEFVTAALILSCRTCRIPLPRRGLKAVEIVGENLLLRVRIESGKRAAKAGMVKP